MEGNNDTGYRHVKRVFKIFDNKHIGDYNLYVQSDTLLLPHVFENFINMCLREYEPDPTYISSFPG